MADEVKSPEPSRLASELNAALTSLDAALLQASRSVAVIRSNVSQFAALAEVVRQMEAAMTRARQTLSMPSDASPQVATSPPLRPVPPREATPEAFEPEAKTSEATLEPSEPEAPTGAPTAAPPQPEPTHPISHCLRLGVSSKAGSLDLKAVDGSVNENPAVVDVALLDYDGRHATLKLWINGSADPNEVRQALLASLRSRLGDERDAEVTIDFEEGSAA